MAEEEEHDALLLLWLLLLLQLKLSLCLAQPLGIRVMFIDCATVRDRLVYIDDV